MDERLSIVEKERFFECRYCNHLVSSENPICGNCGLEMSSEGIAELAKIEDTESDKFNRIYRLIWLMVFNFTTLFLGISYVFLGVQSLFKFFFWSGIALYLVGYFLWKKSVSNKKFSDKEAQVVKEVLGMFFGIFYLTTIIGIFVYIFLIK